MMLEPDTRTRRLILGARHLTLDQMDGYLHRQPSILSALRYAYLVSHASS
jgi:hypothetical protein